jgi:putative FmdB family regulatory protein
MKDLARTNMPIYEYICEACGKTHDALQKMSDAPLTVCPACTAPQLKKKLSAPSFRLSGSGWYETDFKSGNKRNVADSAPKEAAPAPAAACGTGACPACK